MLCDRVFLDNGELEKNLKSVMYTISGFISVLLTFEKYTHVNNHNVKLRVFFSFRKV